MPNRVFVAGDRVIGGPTKEVRVTLEPHDDFLALVLTHEDGDRYCPIRLTADGQFELLPLPEDQQQTFGLRLRKREDGFVYPWVTH